MADFPTPPTGTSQAELEAMFIQLWNNAQVQTDQWMRTRCPPELMPHLDYYLQNNPTVPPPDPTTAVVKNGDPIVVKKNDGTMVAAQTVEVVGGVAAVKLYAQFALVTNSATVPVLDAADAPVTGSPGRAAISASTVQNVKLTA